MSERREPDRLLAFTDAVVAIAMTLLVLPLAEETGGGVTVRALLAVLARDWTTALGFTISFFVIARLWWAHHRVFGVVERLTVPLVAVNAFWLFSVVVFPVTTAFVTRFERSWLTVVLYIGTMTVSAALLTALAWLAHRADASDESEQSLERFTGTLTTTIAFLIALALGALVPGVGYWGLLLLLLTGLVDRIVHRRLAQRAPESVA